MTDESINLSWHNLILNNADKVIINDETGSIGPNSLTALLGPSGAGKTSLLNVLAGRIPEELTIRGQILVNGCERDKDKWIQQVAYVEQSFYAYMNQTVFETIHFTAMLKNKGNLNSKCDDIINQLGLKPVRNAKLSNLSGGELKRVSIGTELIGDPVLLFLDEPTSGLDSFNALNLVNILKQLSEKRTILVTVHQPSYEMSKLFDDVIIMSLGNTIFEGNIDRCIEFFAECGYQLPPNTNPCDYFLDVTAMNPTSNHKYQESVKRIDRFKDFWKEKKGKYQPTTNYECQNTRAPITNSNNSIRTRISSFLAMPSFLILLKRNFIELIRDPKYLKVQVFQKVVFTLLLGLAYLQIGYSPESVQSRTGVIFFLLINSLFGTTGPILNIFSLEKRIIYRERKSGLYSGIVAYFTKFLSLLFFELLFTTVYVSSVYWMVGLYPSAGRFFIFLIIINSAVLFAVALGLTVSTFAPNEKSAQVLGTTILIIFIIFGGSFNNPDTIPGWLRWIIWISPVNYAFRGVMQNQYRGLTYDGGTGEEVLETSGIDYPGVWSNIFGLWGLTLACLLIGAVGLQYLTRIKLKLKG